jgi:hypothetical protein
MSTANVAGVEVDTRHWIGGRRVASGATFTDLSPIDEQPLAEVARGSGIGREGGTWSFDFYGDVKNTVYAPEGWRADG